MGSILRDIRKSKKLRLGDVAKAVGISIPGYHKIETGQGGTNAACARAIAAFLDLPIDRIFVPASFNVTKTDTRQRDSL